jgi:hypothetical protein
VFLRLVRFLLIQKQEQDDSAIAKECDMSNTKSFRTVTTGALLAALLASAAALAESPANAADEAAWQSARAPAVSRAAARPDQSRPRQQAAATAARKNAPPARVYLEDYERVLKQVNRQYPTETYWVGKNPQSK